MKRAKRSDWKAKEPLPSMPSNRTTIRLDRLFSSDEIELIKMGLTPSETDNRCFMYWENEKLFIHRSWTGYCMFVVRFVAEGKGYRMVAADLNREQFKHTYDWKDAKLIKTLIDRLLRDNK